jgi:phenylpropionate dioxygenase-like ring-hydroxylating dioxygenase large terminal subunit
MTATSRPTTDQEDSQTMATTANPASNGRPDARTSRRALPVVEPDAGLVERAVYVDDDVYRDELERVFARAWLYLGHDSQIPEPGDYMTTFMGEDPVILVRGTDGQARAFLNACRHRGMRVCRADEGNTSFFRCPYHAWTYATDGSLRGVPKFREAYEGTMAKRDWGLVQVARIESRYGLLFGAWDEDAPSLGEYLGGFGVYLDLIFGRAKGGLEVIGGAHKWTIETNWKHPAENFACDMYHVESAHQRPAELGLMEPLELGGYEISAGLGYVGHQHNRPLSSDGVDDGVPISAYWTMPNPYTYVLHEQRAAMALELGEELARLIPLGHATIFPNFSLLDTESFRLIRVVHPLAPGRSMVYQWCIVESDLDPEVRDAVRKQYILAFGPAGLLEQDDGENWRECQNGMSGTVGRRVKTNMGLGLGKDATATELLGTEAPGAGGGIWSEANQRQFYRHWRAFMESDGWETLWPRLSELSF